jgi:hypothetical protein
MLVTDSTKSYQDFPGGWANGPPSRGGVPPIFPIV